MITEAQRRHLYRPNKGGMASDVAVRYATVHPQGYRLGIAVRGGCVETLVLAAQPRRVDGSLARALRWQRGDCCWRGECPAGAAGGEGEECKRRGR